LEDGQTNEEWKEKIQGGMYAKMFNEEYGRWPDSIQFIYLAEGERSVHNRISDGEVFWNDSQNKYWDDISKDVSAISNALYNEEWEAKPESSKCYWCDYKFACQEGGIGSENVKPEHMEMGGVL